jgi:hypothetical protein
MLRGYEMFRLVSFFQTSDANVDCDKHLLSTNSIVDAGYKLMQIAERNGVDNIIHYRIEDTNAIKANGKPLVYFFADCTQHPIQYNHLLPDNTHFSSQMGVVQFRNYLVILKNRLNRNNPPKKMVEVFDYVNKRYIYKEEK